MRIVGTIMSDEHRWFASLAVLRLQSWFSPSFPMGAYSYSHGLEWAVEAGDIKEAETLKAWLAVMLGEGGGYCDALLFVHAHRAIMDADDAAQEEISKWVDETEDPKDPLLAPHPLTLRGRMLQRVEPVKERYQQFLRDHPKNSKGEMAYGSFLNDLGEEDEAVAHWERARELDPKDPAAWNNLANVYAHHGPVAAQEGPAFRQVGRNPAELQRPGWLAVVEAGDHDRPQHVHRRGYGKDAGQPDRLVGEAADQRAGEARSGAAHRIHPDGAHQHGRRHDLGGHAAANR